MNIGIVAKKSGLPPKTIRYYEDIGLILPDRLDNGYRSYSEADAEKLRFLQRARSLGFSIEDCRRLLSLYENENRASADVKSLANKHLEIIEKKILELESLKSTLKVLIDDCRGDHRPDCPIINDLAARFDS